MERGVSRLVGGKLVQTYMMRYIKSIQYE